MSPRHPPSPGTQWRHLPTPLGTLGNLSRHPVDTSRPPPRLHWFWSRPKSPNTGVQSARGRSVTFENMRARVFRKLRQTHLKYILLTQVWRTRARKWCCGPVGQKLCALWMLDSKIGENSPGRPRDGSSGCAGCPWVSRYL